MQLQSLISVFLFALCTLYLLLLLYLVLGAILCNSQLSVPFAIAADREHACPLNQQYACRPIGCIRPFCVSLTTLDNTTCTWYGSSLHAIS